MITKVTITGADQSIHPQALADLSGDFPFVEWGILVSRKQSSGPRFPSAGWILELAAVKNEFNLNHPGLPMQLSMHLCGAYVREFLKGDFHFWDNLPAHLFERVQLNTHGEPHTWSPFRVAHFIASHSRHEFIFQYDNVNHVVTAYELDKVSALYDLSHGAGILPEFWPLPLKNCKYGYAGGLGPHNLKEQMEEINQVSGNEEVWIDMETQVRSGSSLEKFDLDKVHRCLEIANAHMISVVK